MRIISGLLGPCSRAHDALLLSLPSFLLTMFASKRHTLPSVGLLLLLVTKAGMPGGRAPGIGGGGNIPTPLQSTMTEKQSNGDRKIHIRTKNTETKFSQDCPGIWGGFCLCAFSPPQGTTLKKHMYKFLAPTQSRDNPENLFMFMCSLSPIKVCRSFELMRCGTPGQAGVPASSLHALQMTSAHLYACLHQNFFA